METLNIRIDIKHIHKSLLEVFTVALQLHDFFSIYKFELLAQRIPFRVDVYIPQLVFTRITML